MISIKNILKFLVISSAIILLIGNLYKSLHTDNLIYEFDEYRNENSTPRSFILPATPAVAYDQEKRALKSDFYKSKLNCIEKLKELEYDVGEEIIEFNAKLKVAIYKFQKVSGLEPTGLIDSRTAETLGCN